MPEANLDEAAAALVALAYLLERKAWMLLPTPEPEPEELGSLEPITASIRGYDLAIEALGVWQAERDRRFFRSPECSPDAYELPYELEGVTSDDLAMALSRLLSRATPTPPEAPERDDRSLSQVVSSVLLAVSNRWKTLSALLPPDYTRLDAVYWFLAVLELIRLGQIAMRLAGDDVEFSRARDSDRKQTQA
jgi:chromatin segregation and condensation protein Rec8/ScpA/Scc1 (kleisin family)